MTRRDKNDMDTFRLEKPGIDDRNHVDGRLAAAVFGRREINGLVRRVLRQSDADLAETGGDVDDAAVLVGGGAQQREEGLRHNSQTENVGFEDEAVVVPQTWLPLRDHAVNARTVDEHVKVAELLLNDVLGGCDARVVCYVDLDWCQRRYIGHTLCLQLRDGLPALGNRAARQDYMVFARFSQDLSGGVAETLIRTGDENQWLVVGVGHPGRFEGR